MPLFEFRCSGCGKKFSQLVGMTADSSEPRCPRCGSVEVSKLISRFSRVRSEDEVFESLEDAAMAGDMDDPRSMSKLVREMGKELGEDGGEDFEEMLEQEMTGEEGEGEGN